MMKIKNKFLMYLIKILPTIIFTVIIGTCFMVFVFPQILPIFKKPSANSDSKTQDKVVIFFSNANSDYFQDFVSSSDVAKSIYYDSSQWSVNIVNLKKIYSQMFEKKFQSCPGSNATLNYFFAINKKPSKEIDIGIKLNFHYKNSSWTFFCYYNFLLN